MIRYGSGIICTPMLPERCDELDLPPMVSHNTNPQGTAFTVSVEASSGITTGVSAADRLTTVRALVHAKHGDELVRPGHIFPLRAHPEGLKGRRGHTEAALQLCLWEGCAPIAVICELCNDDGSMMKGEDVVRFAEEHQLPLTSVEEIVSQMESR